MDRLNCVRGSRGSKRSLSSSGSWHTHTHMRAGSSSAERDTAAFGSTVGHGGLTRRQTVAFQPDLCPTASARPRSDALTWSVALPCVCRLGDTGLPSCCLPRCASRVVEDNRRRAQALQRSCKHQWHRNNKKTDLYISWFLYLSEITAHCFTFCDLETREFFLWLHSRHLYCVYSLNSVVLCLFCFCW